MDTVRSKKSNKKTWIIAGSVLVVLFIFILILCITLSGGDEEDSKDVKTKTISSTKEAFEYVEEVIKSKFEEKDPGTKSLLDELKELDKRVGLLVNLEKVARDTGSKSGSVEIVVKQDEETVEGPTDEDGQGEVEEVTEGEGTPEGHEQEEVTTEETPAVSEEPAHHEPEKPTVDETKPSTAIPMPQPPTKEEPARPSTPAGPSVAPKVPTTKVPSATKVGTEKSAPKQTKKQDTKPGLRKEPVTKKEEKKPEVTPTSEKSFPRRMYDATASYLGGLGKKISGTTEEAAKTETKA